MSGTTAQGREAWAESAAKGWSDADRLVKRFQVRSRRAETRAREGDRRFALLPALVPVKIAARSEASEKWERK
jgi:hypothetical protein